jgi:hypothetical protein
MADHIYIVDTALAAVPINIKPIVDSTDLSKEESLTYNQAGLDLVWHFITPGGAYTQTAVTPTDTGGDYDWVNQGNAHYTIEIPASGGASINNDTEGTGWFTGVATGVLPFQSPVYLFLPAAAANARGLGTNFVTTADLDTAEEVADAVWDETQGGHTAAGSMGLALGTTYSTIVVRVQQCGDAGSATTIDLDAAASAVNDFYKGQLIAIVLGTGAGQARTCTGYNGTTKVATVTPAWSTNPDGDSYFAVLNTGSTIVVDWADGGRLDLILDDLVTAVAEIEAGTGATKAEVMAAILALIK